MSRKSQASGWRNRIVSSGVQAADQFLAHPDNWRTHPPSQEKVLAEILERIGWVDEVVVSKRTGHVLNGHLRVRTALARGDKTPVPFKVVDVTENEETLLLAALDPIAALAGTDRLKLNEVISLIPEDLSGIAHALHAERQGTKKLVAFSASGTFRVIVDCQNGTQQHDLIQRLHGEGYTCRAEGAE
jgi:hypothetical protein